MGNSVTTVGDFELAQRQARAFAGSALVPDALKGSVENCLAAIMLADEMGESRLAVMQNIYFVNGRAAWISAYMVARANKSGKFIGPLRWRTLSHDPLAVECYADLRNAADDDRRVSIVVDMKTAEESGWTTYKKDGKTLTQSRWATPVMQEQMLRWRSASWLIRLYDPECMMGLPTKEELEDISGEMIDVTPPMPKLSDFAPAKAPEEPAEGDLIDTASAWAQKGSYSLRSFWAALSADQKKTLRPMLDTHLKPIAEAADRMNEQNPEDGPPARSPAAVPPTEAVTSPPVAADSAGERKP